MTAPLLIGISGYARAGKDSAASVLVGDGWERRSFADKLREFLYAVNPLVPAPGWAPWQRRRTRRLVDVVDEIGWEAAKDDPSGEVRALLQRLGTDAGRDVLGVNVWVDATLRCVGPESRVVVPDCRFPNEADAIRDRGGIVVRVERPGFGPAVGADGKVHASETSLDDYDFDHVLANDGTLRKLGAIARGVVAVHS